MKAATTEMKAHLAQEVTTLARCWKLIRQDGTAFYFTAHDVDLTIGGHIYKATSGFNSTAISNSADLSVDNLDVQGIFADDAITIEDLRAGLFDYADVYIFFVNWADVTMGVVKLRRGKLGEVTSSPQGFFKAELRGMTQLLQQQIVELYGPTCRADVFDTRCGLIASPAFTSVGHVSAITDKTHIMVVIDTPSATYANNDDWFRFGVLKWTSGDNNGRAIEVKSWNHTTGALEFYLNTGYPVQVADTFTMTPGCDKALATCRDKFDNLLNMRAESYLPGNDQVFNYPDVGGGSG